MRGKKWKLMIFWGTFLEIMHYLSCFVAMAEATRPFFQEHSNPGFLTVDMPCPTPEGSCKDPCLLKPLGWLGNVVVKVLRLLAIANTSMDLVNKIPTCPQIMTWISHEQTCTGTMLPLILRYALTVHSQAAWRHQWRRAC